MSASEPDQLPSENELSASQPMQDQPQRSATLAQRLRGTYVKVISTSWLLSAVLHILALFFIGKVFLPMLPPPPIQELVMGEAIEVVETLDDFQELQIDTQMSDAVESSPADFPVETELTIDEPELAPPTEVPLLTSVEPVLTMADSISDIAAPAVNSGASAVAARSRMKASELRHAGGNAGSEAAVKESLVWLAAHQVPDGGWTLQHNRLVNGCNCGQAGHKKDEKTGAVEAYEARFGATGLALLPFLGSGRTHVEGEYQQVVKSGLAFLVNGIKREGNRGSLRDRGNYYSHGICTIAVCEAYAMTQDPALAEPAQALVNEIIYGQDPVGGGWRYTPKQPGDTSVTGWQFMALKSAKMAGLKVPRNVIEGANTFLDSASFFDGAYVISDGVIAKVTPTEIVVNVAATLAPDRKTIKKPARQVKYTGLDLSKMSFSPGQRLRKGAPLAPYSEDQKGMNGWRYRYMVIRDKEDDDNEIKPFHPTPTLTAVGMLCRMYYGWESDNPLLQRTVNYLAERGPSIGGESKVKGPNMYYNYYATQVLRHRGSVDQWTNWNEALRDYLIETQQTAGHERGSWSFGEQVHGDTQGGRLYSTALACMILEVYYRHMPLYQTNVTASFLDDDN
jgi:hypothetical protein